MQVLLADDDPIFRNLAKCLLEEWGFTVLLASDGAEAWSILERSDAPDLVILDWMMPEMDGYEVCRKIRQTKATRLPYVLLITGKRTREEILNILVAGADDYILKPFEPLDLKVRLRTAIRVLELERQLESKTVS
jgi:DNA-binding response OmpR family regulator